MARKKSQCKLTRMKLLSIILLFISSISFWQNSLGYVLVMEDSTVRLPVNSVKSDMVSGLSIGKVTGLQAILDGKQATLVSGTNIKTINGGSLLGSGNINIAGGAVAWGDISGTLSNQSDLNTALAAKEPTIQAGIASQYYRGDKTWQTLNASAVGLGNVDNTSDAAKPVSTATQTALNLKANTAAPALTGAVTTTGSYGYAATAGGTVTQATNKTTGVTLNKICGQITMSGAALAAAAEVNFVVTNNTVSATDVVIVNMQSVGTANAYLVSVGSVSNGSFSITVSNASAGSLSQAIVLNFAVIKSVNN